MALSVAGAGLILDGLYKAGSLINSGIQNWRNADTKINQLSVSANSANIDYNEAIGNAKDYINTTASAMNDKYGSQLFGILSKQYELLNDGRLVGNDLSKYSGIEAGKVYKLAEGVENLSIGDLGDNVLTSIMNVLEGSDSLFAEDLKRNTLEYRNAIKSSFLNKSQVFSDYKQRFEKLGEDFQVEALSSAQNIGTAQSGQANSGIRATGTGANSSYLAELKDDMLRTSYALTIKQQLTEMGISIDKIQSDAGINVASIRAGIELSKKSAVADAINSVNNTKINESKSMINAYFSQQAGKEYTNQGNELRNKKEHAGTWNGFWDGSWWDITFGNY